MINFSRSAFRLYKLKPQSVNVRWGAHFSSTMKPSPRNDEISNEPIQFFGSKAAAWRARQSRSGGADETLWYQPYVISGSLAVFLIYFCYLREESDVDKKLVGSLFDQVTGLEETTLLLNYKYNKEHGLDVGDIEKRLKELGVDISKL